MKSVNGVAEGHPFRLEIEEHETVAFAKQMIKEKMNYRFSADRLTLYLAKKDDGNWLKYTDPDVKQLKAGEISDSIRNMTKDEEEMNPQLEIGNAVFAFPDAGEASTDELHVLVKIPDNTAPTNKKDKIWTAQELATVHPQVQLDVWKSVVRVSVTISSKVVATVTALVVDRTATHLYLKTNLSLWADNRFASNLSTDFKKEVMRFTSLHPWSSKGKKSDGSPQSTEVNTPQIVIEQLTPNGNTM